MARRENWRSGSSSSLNEIFFHEAASGTRTQLTDNAFNYWQAQINAQGDVVWRGDRLSGDPEIFLYEAASGTTTQLTDTASYDSEPQINANGDPSRFRNAEVGPKARAGRRKGVSR